MAETDMGTPVFSREDWVLMTQLLEAKQRELLAEIRHTDKRSFREALHERLEHVDRLLERLAITEQQG